MTAAGLVLDTSAVLAYARTESVVGDFVARCADHHEEVLVPVLCLAEGHRHADPDITGMLDLLPSLGNVTVVPVEPDMAVFLGGFGRIMGRMDLAQVAITAAEHPIVPVMTSERKLLTQVLPEQWPIVDL